MDFDLSDEQQAIADLAGQILTDRLPPERLKAIEADPSWFAADVWQELAKADLLGIALPEAHGGNGYSVFEACLVLEQIGRAVAPLPYLATVVMGAMTLAEFADAEIQHQWLPGVIAGEVHLSAALLEPGAPLPPDRPATTARPDGDQWILDGAKQFVSNLHLAARVLVPATTDEGVAVFLVDPSASGVTVERLATTNGEPQFHLDLAGVAVTATDLVGSAGQGSDITRWITQRALAGVCAIQSGVCAAALAMTATYTSERRQFDTPIATFQAVAQRAADAYIDTTGVQFTAWQAAWRLAEGLPADDELDIASFWAADGAQRVVHAAQHLHGGIGVDKDYPLHRYFLWAKNLELTLGGATVHLREMGERLAAEPAPAG